MSPVTRQKGRLQRRAYHPDAAAQRTPVLGSSDGFHRDSRGTGNSILDAPVLTPRSDILRSRKSVHRPCFPEVPVDEKPFAFSQSLRLFIHRKAVLRFGSAPLERRRLPAFPAARASPGRGAQAAVSYAGRSSAGRERRKRSREEPGREVQKWSTASVLLFLFFFN